MDLIAKREELTKALELIQGQGRQAQAAVAECAKREVFITGAIALLNDQIAEGTPPKPAEEPAKLKLKLSRAERRRLEKQLTEMNGVAHAEE